MKKSPGRKTIKIAGLGGFPVIPATNAQACVDPRVSKGDPKNDDGAVWSPGASFGFMMSLAAAAPDADSKKVVDTVCDWEQSEGRNVVVHEDNCSDSQKWGCGHRDRASIKANEALYGIPAEKVCKMGAYVRELGESGKIKLRIPVLEGIHHESGVFIIKSLTKTVIPRNMDYQCFRFDEDRHLRDLKSLAKYANKRGIKVDEENLIESAQMQRNVTLTLLAHGLPVYTLTLD